MSSSASSAHSRRSRLPIRKKRSSVAQVVKRTEDVVIKATMFAIKLGRNTDGLRKVLRSLVEGKVTHPVRIHFAKRIPLPSKTETSRANIVGASISTLQKNRQELEVRMKEMSEDLRLKKKQVEDILKSTKEELAFHQERFDDTVMKLTVSLKQTVAKTEEQTQALQAAVSERDELAKQKVALEEEIVAAKRALERIGQEKSELEANVVDSAGDEWMPTPTILEALEELVGILLSQGAGDDLNNTRTFMRALELLESSGIIKVRWDEYLDEEANNRLLFVIKESGTTVRIKDDWGEDKILLDMVQLYFGAKELLKTKGKVALDPADEDLEDDAFALDLLELMNLGIRTDDDPCHAAVLTSEGYPEFQHRAVSFDLLPYKVSVLPRSYKHHKMITDAYNELVALVGERGWGALKEIDIFLVDLRRVLKEVNKVLKPIDDRYQTCPQDEDPLGDQLDAIVEQIGTAVGPFVCDRPLSGEKSALVTKLQALMKLVAEKEVEVQGLLKP
ncbi:hypothetical protein HK102_000016 [Quaeritorhiza haematococci]|nr:hypothetical protein HK102_000016 [Quaeritorhiza haematococci]